MQPEELEIDRLIANLDSRAKAPRAFALWSVSMQKLWLRQHQARLLDEKKAQAGGKEKKAS